MTSSKAVQRAVRHALLVSALGASLSVLAAEPAALKEVVVTGSRIPQPNLESISPVTSITSEEIKAQGITRVEDLLNNLPQVVADFGGNLSNGATGAATVNLRGLGAQRTLVLINGRRLMPGDPTQNGNATPDLNQIPAALVDRVEVLTGGASAVYGADAVAGVVNFVMNDHFEGVRIDANYSFYQHNQHNTDISQAVAARGFSQPDGSVRDGYAKDITFIIGGNFADGKGNITGYAGYRNLSALRQDQRDFSACSLGSGAAQSCAGSSTSFPGRYFANDDGLDYTIANATGGLRRYTANDAFNFAPDNYYQRPDERYTAGMFAHYDFSEHAQVYTEFSFMDDRTISEAAASGAFFGSGTGTDASGIPDASWVTNCSNPLLSATQKAHFCGTLAAGVWSLADGNNNAHILLGRRNVEGGARQDDLAHTSFRTVIGSRGEIAKGLKYDIYGLYGTTRLSENFLNDVSKFKLSNALRVVFDPATGTNVCQANLGGANGAPGCVPYDIWNLGKVTPAAVEYISAPGFQEGITTERVVSGSVTAELGEYGIKVPMATDGIGIALGVEYRQEKSELKVDQEYLTGDLAGQGSKTLPANGQFTVHEAFTEIRVPIVQDHAFAKALDIETGYRYSDYSLGFSTNTYKFGVDWAPVSDFRVRGSYQRAVRAPNIQELFLPAKVQLDGSTDPCSTATPDATLAECARSGVTAGQYGSILDSPAGQYNGLTFGNANLLPETADTYALGFVFTPAFAPTLNITVDYFDIKVKNTIGTYGADYVINTCLNTGASFFCNKVHRSPGNPPGGASLWIGDLAYIEDGTYNLGFQQTKGLDISTNYDLDAAGAGHVRFAFVGSYVQEFVTQPDPASSVTYDCAGLYGPTCGVPTPKWRHKLRATWSTPVQGFDVNLQWRHVHAVDLETTSSNPVLNGAVPLTDAKLGSREYLDVGASLTLKEKYTFRVGVNNLLDKDPPTLGANNLPSVFGNGNTFPQVYDTLGRFVFLNLTADF